MRTLIASMAVALMMAGSAFAEDGAVSNDTLASFGLGGMQTMTDAQGTQVRGKFVHVWGVSNVSLFGSQDLHGYDGYTSARLNATGNSNANLGLNVNGSFVIGGIGGGGGGIAGGFFNGTASGVAAGSSSVSLF